MDSCTDANPKVIRTETAIIDSPQRPIVSCIRTSFHTQCRSHFFRPVIGEKARSIDADRTSRTTPLEGLRRRGLPIEEVYAILELTRRQRCKLLRELSATTALSGSSEMRLSSVANTSCLSSRCWWFRLKLNLEEP